MVTTAVRGGRLKMQQLADDYNQQIAVGEFNLSKSNLQCAMLKTTTQRLEQAAAIAAITAFQPQQGWLQYQSRIVVIATEDTPWQEKGAGQGRLLDAELCRDGGRSLHLRTLPGGMMIVTEMQREEGDGEAAMLVETVYQLATGKCSARYLQYDRYWKRDEEIGMVATAVVFRGFKI